jgi:hypothetical protein
MIRSFGPKIRDLFSIFARLAAKIAPHRAGGISTEKVVDDRQTMKTEVPHAKPL